MRESAAWFRDTLEELGHSQSSLARLMTGLGDPRPPAVILRSINRMATAQSRVSGEMRVILRLLQSFKPFDPAVHR